MNINSSLRTSVWNVVTKALSYDFPTMPAIFAFQDGTEPKESYVTINLLSSRQVGHAQTGTLTDTQETLRFAVTYEADIQLSFFGSQSGDAISSFVQNINNNPLVLEEIRKNNLGFLRKTQVRNNPQKRDTVWVDSYNMVITINYTIGSEQLVDIVENVIIENSYDYKGQGWLVTANNSTLGVDWSQAYNGTSFTYNGTTTYDANASYTVSPPPAP